MKFLTWAVQDYYQQIKKTCYYHDLLKWLLLAFTYLFYLLPLSGSISFDLEDVYGEF